MKFKKAQATLFVILGIVIMTIIILSLTFIKKTESNTNTNLETNQEINYFINTCIEASLKQAIITTTKIGYIENELLIHNQKEYGFFIKDSNKYFKNKIETESTISKKFKEELILCLDDFNPIKEQGYDVRIYDIITKVLLTEQVITAEATINMTASINNMNLLQTKYVTTINYPLLKYHDLLEEYVQEQINSEFFLISNLAQRMHQHQIPYAINYAQDETIVIQITLPDNNNQFKENLIMRFAIK
jgi:hypothetical protein